MTIVHVEARQAELLSEINKGLPTDLSENYQILIEKRRAGTLSPQEHAELLRLSDQVEFHGAERVAALAELANLRGTTLRKLMAELGIQAPPDA